MRILVTGGAGFIGSHLCDALLADGHTVTVLDDLSSGSIENLPRGIAFAQQSLLDDLTMVFQKAKPEVIFHLAAQIDVRKSVEDPSWDADINIKGSLNLLNAAKRFGCKRIIFSSTGGALYGETDRLPTPESHATKPESPYGVAKLAVEGYLRFFSIAHGFSVCVLRYGNVYGPRQALKGEAGVVAVFTKSLLKEQQPTIFGNGKQTRDYVYVKDVVLANVVALHKKLEGTFNVGTGKETSVNDVYAQIAKALEFPWKANYGPAVKGELQRSCLSIDALKPYWKPSYGIERGIPETVAWFKEYEAKANAPKPVEQPAKKQSIKKSVSRR